MRPEIDDYAGRNIDVSNDHVLWCDCWITRRKRFNLITTPGGEVEFRSQLLGECIDWLAERDVKCYVMATEHWTVRVDVLASKQEQD